MASFAGKDLKMWREMQKISAAELAEKISCDTSTIYKFESGKIRLNPDTMFQICEVLGDVSRWCEYMRCEYPMSYGRVHPEIPQYDLSGAIMSLYAVISDLQEIQKAVLYDGADGKMDNPSTAERLKQEVEKLAGTAQLLLNLLTDRKER